MTLENAQKIILPNVSDIQADRLMKQLEEDRIKRIERRKAVALSSDGRETEEMHLVNQAEVENVSVDESENSIQTAQTSDVKNKATLCSRFWGSLRKICVCFRKYKELPKEAKK